MLSEHPLHGERLKRLQFFRSEAGVVTLCHFFPQLHAPLIEAVNVPEEPTDDGGVLVHGQEGSQMPRGKPFEKDKRTRFVPRKRLVRRLRPGFTQRESLALGEHAGDEVLVAFGGLARACPGPGLFLGLFLFGAIVPLPEGRPKRFWRASNRGEEGE